VKLVSFLAALTLVALAVASGAAPKEGARARLAATVPLAAPPGSAIRVDWTVSVAGENGERRPFAALNMFVRLLSRTGASATTGFSPQRGTTGRYAAQVKVPQGGIGGIRFGLRGTTDVTFPLENDPFRSRGGLRCDVATTRAILAAFVGAYNRGDLRSLDRLFSRTRFRWYSANAPGARLRAAAFNRETLVAYFRRRHSRGDRLRLVDSRFNGYSRGSELAHFDLRARRRADDFRGGRWFDLTAKGALDCAKPPVAFAVLSLGGPSR
jgi:hypothetical protein